MADLDFLEDDERAVVQSFCKEFGMSERAVIRQALRHYQFTHKRLAAGETCTWSGDAERARRFAGPALVQSDE